MRKFRDILYEKLRVQYYSSKTMYLKFDKKNLLGSEKNHTQIIEHQTFNFSNAFTIFFAVFPSSKWHPKIAKRSPIMLQSEVTH